MKRFLVACALFLISCSVVNAQWQVPSGAIPVGRGPGVVGFNSTVNTVQVSPEQFGYTTYASGDAGPAINAAIASVAPGLGVRVSFGPHQYNIVTPILISKDFVWLQGTGLSTVLRYFPTTNGTAMITWHNAAVTTGVYSGRLTDMMLLSGDFTHTKTAINLIDIGEMEVSGIYIPLWTDGTFSSVGLQTNGREVSSFHDLKIFADDPIVIASNPNFPIHADHFHFWNLYLIPAASNPCITATPDMFFTNSTFDGYQAWVGGTYGFYHNAVSNPGRGFGLAFSNVRVEGGTSPTAYNFYINATSGNVAQVSITNSTLDETRLGIFARGVLSLTLKDIYYPAVVAMRGLDLDATDASVLIENARWENGATQSIGSLFIQYSYITGGNTVPSNALYTSLNLASSAVYTTVLTTPMVVNSLPSCVAGTDGMRAFVTNNATAIAFGGAVTTGGAFHSPVYCDGSTTSWKQG